MAVRWRTGAGPRVRRVGGLAGVIGAMLLLACDAKVWERTSLGGSVAAEHQSTPPFGFGRSATPEEIAALDIDVMPDGTGLPGGRGTVAQGAAVYAQRCAVCHGPTGTEGPNDRLVGRLPDDEFPFANDPRVRLTIGNYWPYATTVFDYVRRAMPFDAPGSLTGDEVYGLVAYVLFLNEIVTEDAVMDAATLPAVVMPSRDRFVPDDRVGGPEIR